MSLGLSVLTYGMVTAVGFNGPSSCTALQAGVRGVRVDNLWDPTGGAYLACGRVRLPQWWEGRAMLAELVAPAIEECLENATDLLAQHKIAKEDVSVFLIVSPPDRPCRWPDLDAEALRDLERKLGRALTPTSRLIVAGRTGIVQALALARGLPPTAPFCIVAGVESLLQQGIVRHYVEEQRLLCANNSNGFSLGEAAAAVLLGPSGIGYGPELALLGAGSAFDPSGAGGTPQHPVTGNGLTAAIRHALAGAAMPFFHLDLQISDANGEHFKFKELSLTSPRLSRPRPPSMPPRRYGIFDHWHPIEFTGEVGAAIFPLMLGYAYSCGEHRLLHGPRVLFLASEDAGDRAAVITEYRPGSRGAR